METSFRRPVVAVLIALTLAFSASAAFGQGIVTGSISGTVEDPQGAVVSGAKIIATQLATNRQYLATTTHAGAFAINVLPPGDYDVKIEAPSFRAAESHRVSVAVGADTSLGVVRLEVGSPSETVTVEGTAPILETTTDQITNTFDSQQVPTIPIGNNFDTLALFLPGVAPLGDAGFSNTNGEGFSANGQRGRANNFQIDGQGNNDNSIAGPSIFFGNQDAIQEVQVLTNYDAEYGRNMGSVVNYVTKAGTNQFHGTGYEFWAGNTFASLANQDKSPVFGFCPQGVSPSTGCTQPVMPKYVDNRFGGTLGGPIWKDKIWFFGSANFERTRGGASPSFSPGPVPTPTGIQQLSAAFPNSPVGPLEAAIGPATLTSQGNPTFTNIQNILVTNQIDQNPADSGFGSAFPCTTAGVNGCVPIQFATISRLVPSPFNDYEGTGRVDVKVTSKDNFFGRYVFQQTISDGVNFGNGLYAGDWQKIPARDQQIGLDWVHSFSTNFLNQARFSYSRANVFFEEGSQTSCNHKSPLGCAADIIMLGSSGPDSVGFGIAAGFPQGRLLNVWQVQDNLTHNWGRHLLKFGGEYDKQRSPNVFLPGNNSEYFFNSFNDIAANNPAETVLVVGNPNLPFHEKDVAAYFQDDWKVKDNLTLNLGVRWEWNQQAINLLHDRTVAVQNGPNPLWDNSFGPAETEVPKVPEHYHNFGPVFGFAWTPGMLKKVFGEQKTVIRGGFRLAYDPEFYNMFLNVATSSPSVNSAAILPPPAVSLPLAPPPAPLPSSGNYQGNQIVPFLQSIGAVSTAGINPGRRNHTIVAPNFRSPYGEQWNLGVQRSFTSRIVGEVRYVGNHSVGQFQSINGNPALGPLQAAGFGNLIPSGLTPCTDPTQPGSNAGYANCNFRRVVERGNFAWSKYNSLQSELRIGAWHGLTATASYTYSRTFDNASEVYSSVSGGNTLSFAQNPFNTDRAERANSGFDFPHLVGVTFIYDIPYRKSQQGLLGHLLGGWQASTTYRYATGQPYTTIQSHNGGSLCDPTATDSGTYDACRPILSNAAAPQTSVGAFTCTGATAGTCSLADFVTGAPTSLSAVHWVYNDPNAAIFYGTPFAGGARNTLRGQPISTANLAFFKDIKVHERLTLQFQAQCYNCMNVQFRGTPVSLLNVVGNGTPSPFQSTAYNFNGGGNNFVGGGTFSANAVYDGIDRRRLLFGLKVKF
jgi:outer membrane receptor protein involved in Fe transport